VLQCVAACCSVSEHKNSYHLVFVVCCSMLQYVAVCCSVLQCVAAGRSSYRLETTRTYKYICIYIHIHIYISEPGCVSFCQLIYCNTSLHTATNCSTLQYTAHTTCIYAAVRASISYHAATDFNTLQPATHKYKAVRASTSWHVATRCNKL